jgi:two-component system phosphate regulon response regulator PhoB
MKSIELPPAPNEYKPLYRDFEPGRGTAYSYTPSSVSSIGSIRSKLLVVAREELVLLLKGILDLHGFQTITAIDFATAGPIAREERPDAIVLDESISQKADLATASSTLIDLSHFAPVLVLETDRRIFADFAAAPARIPVEILARPWAPEELILRLALLVRKAPAQEQECLSFADMVIDLQRHVIHRNGRRIDVTPIEFHLLEHFMRNPRKVFSREELHKAAWPKNVFVELRTVDVHVGKLRRALSAAGEPNLIRTVRTCGYALDADL